MRHADFIRCRADTGIEGAMAPCSFLLLTHLHEPPKPIRMETQEGDLPRSAPRGSSWPPRGQRLPQTGGDHPGGPCTAQRPSPHQARGAGHGWAQGQPLPPSTHTSFSSNPCVHRTACSPECSQPPLPMRRSGRAGEHPGGPCCLLPMRKDRPWWVWEGGGWRVLAARPRAICMGK